jgi:hypothetical protein
MTKLNRAYSPSNIIQKKFKVLEFDGKWEQLIGKPELNGHWIVWGNSGNGKTDFIVKLAKYLCNFSKVVFNPLEEGVSESIKQALIRNHMEQEEGKFMVLNKEPFEILKERLKRRKAPKVAIIDSFQYTELSKKEFRKLDDEFPQTLFVWVSHAEGKNPEGRPAKALRYHANVKIYVEGFKASCQSRYGGGDPLIIWRERAAEYHGELD